MKANDFFCCIPLAFANQKLSADPTSYGRSWCRRRSNGYINRQLRLWNGDEHTTNDWNANGGGDNHNLHDSPNGRRTFFQTASTSFIASMLSIPMSTKPARAACLSGDIRPDCIGVYKLPIDAAESPYVETPEKLKLYAPDLQWVPPVEYPKSYADALAQLKSQRQQLDSATELIAKGDIEQTGLVLLDIIPKVGAAGIVILQTYGKAANDERNAAMKEKNIANTANTQEVVDSDTIGIDGNPSSTPKATILEMKFYRIQYALDELKGYLGETDVLIGQGLRGDLGVSAPAQLQILSNLQDCRREFDTLLATIPETFTGF